MARAIPPTAVLGRERPAAEVKGVDPAHHAAGGEAHLPPKSELTSPDESGHQT